MTSFLRRFGEILHRRKPFYKTIEIRNNGLYLRLLKHDFRKPADIRIMAFLPRKIVSTVFFLPGN